jgi:hypothetical protein
MRTKEPMMNRAMRISMLTLAAGAAAMISMPAGAGGPEEKKLEGSYSQPLGHTHASTKGVSRITVVQNDGDTNVELTIEGDRVSATVNGEEIPAERIKRRGARVEILDAEGRIVRALTVPGAASAAGEPGGQRTARWFAMPEGQGGASAQAAQPPVMVGITMSDPDPGVLDALGLDSGIRVERVVEGLPAEKSGLRAGDIIVAAGGKSPVTADEFRAMLREKKPGDTIEVKVLRRGKQETFKVELAPFDADKLQVVARRDGDDPENYQQLWNFQGVPGMPQMFSIPPGFDSAEARRQLERAREEIRKAIDKVRQQIQDEDLQGRVREQAERLVEELARVRESLRDQARGFREAPEGLRFRAPDSPVPPAAPQAPREGRGDSRELQIEILRRENRELREQLERMNGRFDELMKRLDEMSNREP